MTTTTTHTRPPGRGALGLQRDELEALLRVPTGQVVARIVVLFGAWFALGALVLATDLLAVRIGLWLVLGFVINGIVQLAHETWHHNLFRSRRANVVFGHLLGLLVGISYDALRHDHLAHHRHNRTPRDPDAYNVGRDGLGTRLLFYAVVGLGLVLSVVYFNLIYPLQHMRRRELRRHVAVLAVYAAVHVAVWSALASGELVGEAMLVWGVPLLFTSPYNGLKSIADHHANAWRGDATDTMRFRTATTVRTSRFVTWMWSGLNHHLDHHLFPRVPGANLARLHTRLRPVLEAEQAPLFDGYPQVMWAALRAGPILVEQPAELVSLRRRVRENDP